MKQPASQHFEQLIMPVNESAIAFGENLLIMDSMVSPLNHLDEQWRNRHFPMKLSQSCLLIVERGTLHLKFSFNKLAASDNTCVIINKDTIIENLEVDENCRIILISYTPMNAPSVNAGSNVFPLCNEHLTMLKQAYQMLRTILNADAFAINRDDVVAHCLSFIISIITQASNSQQQSGAKPTRRDEIVARFMQCVHDNYREHRELSFYADQLGLSLKYMSHVVFERTGRHPANWIKDYVILDAKTMLRSGKYTVLQIADELHFPNQSFFGKYFKEATGVSPKKWK